MHTRPNAIHSTQMMAIYPTHLVFRSEWKYLEWGGTCEKAAGKWCFRESTTETECMDAYWQWTKGTEIKYKARKHTMCLKRVNLSNRTSIETEEQKKNKANCRWNDKIERNEFVSIEWSKCAFVCIGTYSGLRGCMLFGFVWFWHAEPCFPKTLLDRQSPLRL